MKMNRVGEAKKVMQEALPMGTMLEVHFYGRELINIKEIDEAFKVFKQNFEKYPNEYTTIVGLGRAYSAKGDYKKALQYMKTALAKAPDDRNKLSVESMITRLQEGKDVN